MSDFTGQSESLPNFTGTWTEQEQGNNGSQELSDIPQGCVPLWDTTVESMLPQELYAGELGPADFDLASDASVDTAQEPEISSWTQTQTCPEGDYPVALEPATYEDGDILISAGSAMTGETPSYPTNSVFATSPLPLSEQRDRSYSYAEVAAGRPHNPTNEAPLRPTATSSLAAASRGKLKLVRKGTNSIQQEPGKRIRHHGSDSPGTDAQTQPGSGDPIVDSEITTNPNWQPGSSSSATIEEWNAASKVPGDRKTPPLSLVTSNLGNELCDSNTHLKVPTTPQQQPSPTLSSPASSARSARRTLEEMKSSPASFRCEECDAGFDTRQDVRHHRRNHIAHGSRPHVCEKCGKDFLHPKDLRRHEKKYNQDPAERFLCPYSTCKRHEKGFNREDHCKRHVDKQHPGAEPDALLPSPVSSQPFSGDDKHSL